MSLGKLVIELAADTGKFETDMGRAARIAERKSKQMRRELAKIGKQLAGIGTAAAAGFGLMVREQVQAADELGKLSQRIGASTEALSQYQHVAKLAGVSFQTLTMGWQRMTRRVGEAAKGTGEAKGALLELGLSVQSLAQMRPEAQFEAIADALSKVENSSRRVALAQKVWDSEGVALLQMAQNGADALRAMREEADRLGLTISGQTAKDAAELNDQFTRMGALLNGVAMDAAKQLLPVMRQLTDDFGRGKGEIADYADNALTLGKGLKTVAAAGLVGKNALEILGKSLAGITAFISNVVFGTFDAFAQQLTSMGGAIKSLFAGDFADAAAQAKAAANVKRLFSNIQSAVRTGLRALDIALSDTATDFSDIAEGWDAIWNQTTEGAEKSGTVLRNTFNPALAETVDLATTPEKDTLLEWLNDLEGQLDPSAKAMADFTKMQIKLEEAVRRGLITEDKAARLMELWGQNMADAADAAQVLAVSFQQALADDFSWFWDNFIRTGQASFDDLMRYFGASSRKQTELALFGDQGLQGFLFGTGGDKPTAGLLGSGGEMSPWVATAIQGASIGGSISGNGTGQLYGAIGGTLGSFARYASDVARTSQMLGAVGGLIGSILGGLLAGGNKDKILFGSYNQNYGPGTRYTSALGGFSFDARGSEDSYEGRRTEIVNAFRELDRVIALSLNPDQIDAATEALANFHVVMKNGEIDLEALRVERWQTAIRAADDQFGEFLASFTDVNQGLAAMRAIYDLVDFTDDIDLLVGSIGDAAGNLRFEMNNIGRAIQDGEDMLASALAVGDPEAVRQAQETLTQAVMRRYEYEMQQINQIMQQLSQLSQAATNFTVGIYDRIAALGGGLNDTGKFGVRSYLSKDRGLSALGGRIYELQGAVLNPRDTQQAINDLNAFIQTVDAWLNRARARVNSWLTEQLAGITARREELDAEAQAILSGAQARAEQAAQAAAAAAQAAQAARQREIQALQDQLNLANQWVSVLQTAEQMLRDLTFSAANPMGARARYGLLAQDVESQYQQFLAGGGDANQLLQALGQQLTAAQGLYQRPSGEYQAIYNEVMARIAEVRDKAQEEADKAKALQEELNYLQSQTVGAINTQTATQIALTAEEQARLEEIEAERKQLAEQEAAAREQANALLAEIEAQALEYYQWAQSEGERLYQQRHDELMAQLNEITGGMEVNAYIAQLQEDTRDYLRMIATDIGEFLDSIRNGASSAIAPDVGGELGGGDVGPGEGPNITIRVDGTQEIQDAVIDMIPTIKRELAAA